MGLLEAIFASRRRDDPSGRINESTSERDADNFAADDNRDAYLDGLRIWISYRDASGETSARWVQVFRIESRENGEYLVAHCELRDAIRTFRLDRINEVADRFGEVHNPETFFRPFTRDAPHPRRAKPDRGFIKALRVIDFVGDELKVLAFMAEADGQIAKSEMDVMFRYAAYRCEALDVSFTRTEKTDLQRWIKSLAPDAKALRAAIARIASRSVTTWDDLWELSGIVVAIDNKITKPELAAMDELRAALQEEFQAAAHQ